MASGNKDRKIMNEDGPCVRKEFRFIRPQSKKTVHR